MRSAALGEALPAEARRGLSVFLARGMWVWARMMVPGHAPLEPIITRSSPNAQPIIERQSFIYVLAGMAVTVNERRTR
jgi:hypothetical protein